MRSRPTCSSAAGALLGLACACGAAPDQPRAPAGAASSPERRAEPAADIEALFSPAPGSRAELHALSGELAADWTREAGQDKDAADILALLHRELADKLTAVRGAGPDAELEVLRAEVYDRRARALGRRSFALGKAVIDGAIDAATARTTGTQILDEVAALAPQLRALRDRERARVLSDDLQEVSLEATFAIERGPTSRRLDDYRSSRAGAPDVR